MLGFFFAALRREPEHFENIRCARQRCRTKPKQRIRPDGERGHDLSRDCKDLAALFEREISRDQRALRSRASTTTVATQRPAMMRLRAGNRNGAGATPGSYSD